MKVFQIFNGINVFMVIGFSVFLDVGFAVDDALETINIPDDRVEEDVMEADGGANIIQSPMNIVQIIFQTLTNMQMGGQAGSPQTPATDSQASGGPGTNPSGPQDKDSDGCPKTR